VFNTRSVVNVFTTAETVRFISMIFNTFYPWKANIIVRVDFFHNFDFVLIAVVVHAYNANCSNNARRRGSYIHFVTCCVCTNLC